MRRLFESFLVLQDRSTGTTPMAGGQSHRLLGLSSAQSSVAHLLGRPLARSLGHSVARSLFRSFSGPPRNPFARPLGRSFVRSLGRARARHLALLLPRLIVRSFACLRTLARALAGSAPRALIHFRTRVLARVRAIVRSCSVARPLVRFACSVARSVGHSFSWSLGCPYARSLCC